MEQRNDVSRRAWLDIGSVTLRIRQGCNGSMPYPTWSYQNHSSDTSGLRRNGSATLVFPTSFVPFTDAAYLQFAYL